MSDDARDPENQDTNRSPLLMGLAGALVAAAVLVPVMLLLTREGGPDRAEVSGYLASESSDVERTSEQVFDLLVNYDSATIEDVADEMLGLSTGNFRDQYEELVGTGLNDALEEAAASSEGEILEGPQVTFRTSTEAVALAGVEQTTRSSQEPEGRTFTYLMRLTLVLDGDEWKADQIEILSGEVA